MDNYFLGLDKKIAKWKVKYCGHPRLVLLKIIFQSFKLLFLPDKSYKFRLDKKYPSVAIAPGIGDALWSFMFIPALLKKLGQKRVNLIACDAEDQGVVRKRSYNMLERFGFVEKVIPFNFRMHPEQIVDPETGCYNYIPLGKNEITDDNPFDYSYIVNGELERGKSLEEIAKELNLDPKDVTTDVFSDYKVFPEDEVIANKLLSLNPKGYIVLYFGPLKGNTEENFNRGELWKTYDWYVLSKLLHDIWKLPIVIIGAHYDLSYYNKFLQEIPDYDSANSFVNLIGVTSLPETIALLKKAYCVVGYTCGMPITSTYLGTRTAMFWRPQNLSLSKHLKKHGFSKEFCFNWVPKKMVEENRYITLWYSEDDGYSVFEKMVLAGWSPDKDSEKKALEFLKNVKGK